MGGSQIEQ